MKPIMDYPQDTITITVTPSSAHHTLHNEDGKDSKYDAMPAVFARPLKGHNVKARLFHFDRDDNDTLCPITDSFDGMEEDRKDGSNIWGSSISTDTGIDMKVGGASVGDTMISQGLTRRTSHDGAEFCLSDKPVALLVSRGNCTFEAKAMEALINSPSPLLQKPPKKTKTAVSYLIIYDNQISAHTQYEQEHINLEYHVEDDDPDTHPTPPLIRMSATNKEKKILMEDMPITLLFVSYETGMALKQAIRDTDQRIPNDVSGNHEDCDDKNGVMLTFNHKDTLYQQHRNHHHAHEFPKEDTTKETTDNDDGNADDYYFPSNNGEDPTRILLVQMITAISLMFSFIFCVGCWMICCCGHPGITVDGNGFVFGRPDDEETEMRLLTEDEVFNLPEVKFVARRDSNDSDNDDLEAGPRKSMDINDTSTDTLVIHSNLVIAGADDNTISSSPLGRRQQPLQHYCSSSLNYDSLNFNAMCSICLEEYEEGEMLRMLPCHHLFHTECIIPWLTERFPNCPLCKAHVIAEQQQDGDGEGTGATMEGNEEDGDNSINEEEVIEDGGGESSNTPIRNFFEMMALRRNQQQHSDNVGVEGGGERGGSSSSDQIMSNFRTPLLQDFRSPPSSSSLSLSSDATANA